MNLEKNFESQFINIDKIFHKALEKLEENKIEMDEFKDLYGEERVEKDKEKVEKLKKKFDSKMTDSEKEAKKLATIFEVIVNENLELSDWMGPAAETRTTTDYDDFINGVDTVVEFQEEDDNASNLGLAIDATFANELRGKFEKIKENIEKGKLATIEYFESPDESFKGRLSYVPRVVIGAEKEVMDELVDLWYRGKKKELGSHPIQFQILEEIKIQLEAFSDYANRIGQDQLVQKFNRISKIINKVIEEKGGEGAVSDEDKALLKIKRLLSREF